MAPVRLSRILERLSEIARISDINMNARDRKMMIRLFSGIASNDGPALSDQRNGIDLSGKFKVVESP